jgi:hypothetical protein
MTLETTLKELIKNNVNSDVAVAKLITEHGISVAKAVRLYKAAQREAGLILTRADKREIVDSILASGLTDENLEAKAKAVADALGCSFSSALSKVKNWAEDNFVELKAFRLKVKMSKRDIIDMLVATRAVPRKERIQLFVNAGYSEGTANAMLNIDSYLIEFEKSNW